MTKLHDAALSRPVRLPVSDDSRRRALDWGIVAAVGAALSILAALGSWIQAARRQARLPDRTVTTRRFHADSTSESRPSERVRELIRRNPEVAASVLERWACQGSEGS